ncbi:MAG TPA: HAMP domain-containing sensor histidine kinase [Candidatus Acidoferrum sp.]|nr:HAMP domain-containing sensor histidine kinase [Candidatus Acidoferrum sp.]
MYGVANVIDAELEFFANSKKRIDTCMNYTRPSLAVILEPIKKAFLDAKDRSVKLRYLTEITHDNIAACKELMTIVDELRHLDGIKGNFMVSETEYLAPVILFEKGEIAPQAVYSNLKEVVEQQQYIFDSFWIKAMDAEERIKEIEEGRVIHYETKVLKNQEEIGNKIKELLDNSNELLVCVRYGGLQLGYSRFLDLGKELMDKHRKGEHKGIRLVTTAIDRDSAELVKMLLDFGIQIREIKNMPPMNFSVTDKELHATIDDMEDGNMVQSVLVSNEPLYVNHFGSVFEKLWENASDTRERMASVDEGVEMPDIEVIPNASIAREFYLNAVKNAHEEIMIMFPTTNAFLRQYKMGAAQLAKESAQKRKVKVRILMPKHESTEQSVRSLTEDRSPYSNYYIDIRYIEQTVLDTQATFLVVDRKVSLVMEIRDDSKTTFDEAIGLSTYSNSKAGVLSYVAIFENLWKQTELYEEIKKAHEQLKLHAKAQKEFINIAAHELRTPIQPILGLSQILLSRTGSIQENNELLDTINRNAKRLSRLTDDILDVTKIESKSLELKKERFNLNNIIINAIDDIILGKDLVNSSNVQLLYEPKDIVLEADKGRMSQVFSNLISNAIKFTKKGTITIATKIDEGNNQTIISVKDTGQGIDPEILPRLFSKFAAKSETGTGLGLFISKSIVEAHDGKIWAENNADGKGAKFSFSLPIKG